jgi:sulfur carrier protein
MVSNLTIQINGQNRSFSDITPPARMMELVETLGLKSDRIAVEMNGQIVPRAIWDKTEISEGDRLEIVHFVGGGTH